MIILLFMAALVLLYIIGTNLIFYFLVKGFLYILPILIVYWIYVYLKNHKKITKRRKEDKMMSNNERVIFITIILTCIVATALMINAL